MEKESSAKFYGIFDHFSRTYEVTKFCITTLCRLNPGRKKKINLDFHFHTSLLCLKRFYESFLRHHSQRNVRIKIQVNFYFNTAL